MNRRIDDAVFCLLLALIALILWAAIVAWIRWTIGGISFE
jgi:hypothetical protein